MLTKEQMAHMKARNVLITIAVLKGHTLNAVGNVYGLSRERIRQIVYKLVKRSAPEVYSQLDNKISIKEYRKYKNRLITAINN